MWIVFSGVAGTSCCRGTMVDDIREPGYRECDMFWEVSRLAKGGCTASVAARAWTASSRLK